MADLDIGGGAGGAGGIPTRYVIIGAGVLGVGAILLMQRRGGGGGEQQSYGANLGPNAALALGSLETRLAQESGNLQLLMRDYRDELGEQLDTAAAGLSDAFAGGVGRLSGQLGQLDEQSDAYFSHLNNVIGQNKNLLLYFGWKNARNATPDIYMDWPEGSPFTDGELANTDAAIAYRQPQG